MGQQGFHLVRPNQDTTLLPHKGHLNIPDGIGSIQKGYELVKWPGHGLAFFNKAKVVSDKNELAIILADWKKFQIPSYSGVFIVLHLSL